MENIDNNVLEAVNNEVVNNDATSVNGTGYLVSFLLGTAFGAAALKAATTIATKFKMKKAKDEATEQIIMPTIEENK